jgi:hypothetical protein
MRYGYVGGLRVCRLQWVNQIWEGALWSVPHASPFKQAEFTAEMIVHSPGLKNIDRPGVWLFPELRVCLDCGFCRFTVSEANLASVTEGNLTDKSSTLEESATQR